MSTNKDFDTLYKWSLKQDKYTYDEMISFATDDSEHSNPNSKKNLWIGLGTAFMISSCSILYNIYQHSDFTNENTSVNNIVDKPKDLPTIDNLNISNNKQNIVNKNPITNITETIIGDDGNLYIVN